MNKTAVVLVVWTLCVLIIDPADAGEHAVESGRLQVGEVIAVHLESPELSPGSQSRDKPLFVHEIHDPGATYICPRISDFDLAAGDRVVVRSPDGRRSWTYTADDEKRLDHGDGFWAIHIPGDRAIVELWSEGGAGAPRFAIDAYARGFVNIYSPEELCGADDKDWAQCYSATEPGAYDASRIVARLLIQGSGLCTGWLVGTEGHLLTNNHCIENQADASNTNFEFMAEGACGQFCGQLQCGGTVAATSSTLVKTNSQLDYSLVLLATNPAPTYGGATLRESGPVAGERIYIPQHPLGYGKQIAVESTHPDDASGYAEVDDVANVNISGVGIRRCALYFADTSGGSSGAPVFGYDDHQVVGLHFGSFGCTGLGNAATAIDAVIGDLGADLPDSAIAVFRDGFEDGSTNEWSSTVGLVP